MDRNAAEETRILNLLQEAQQVRSRIGSGIGALRTRLDPVARLRGSLRQHPSAWMIGSLVAGLGARLLLRRPAPIARVFGGPLGAVLGLAMTTVRPLVKVWLANRLREWLASQAQHRRRMPTQDTRSH
jgi:hypothetical protein